MNVTTGGGYELRAPYFVTTILLRCDYDTPALSTNDILPWLGGCTQAWNSASSTRIHSSVTTGMMSWRPTTSRPCRRRSFTPSSTSGMPAATDYTQHYCRSLYSREVSARSRCAGSRNSASSMQHENCFTSSYVSEPSLNSCDTCHTPRHIHLHVGLRTLRGNNVY